MANNLVKQLTIEEVEELIKNSLTESYEFVEFKPSAISGRKLIPIRESVKCCANLINSAEDESFFVEIVLKDNEVYYTTTYAPSILGIKPLSNLSYNFETMMKNKFGEKFIEAKEEDLTF